jgi:tetratricopeptide (TPR) repeat protein
LINVTPQEDSEAAFHRVAMIGIFASLAHEPPAIPDERILIAVSLVLWSMGRVSEAVTGFRLLDRSGALPIPGILAWGWWLLYSAELDKAEDLFSRAQRMEPDNDEATLGMAYLRLYQENYAASAGLFSSLAARGKFNSPKVMAPAAQALAEGRRPKELQPAPLLGLPPGLAHLYQRRQLAGKIPAIQLAQSQIPSSPPENLLPLRRLILEWQFEDMDSDPRQLRSELEGLVKEYPDEGRLWQFLGMALRRLGLLDESRDAFGHAAETAPLDAGTWAGWAASLVETKNLELAYHCYETAVFLDPGNAQYLTELATCYAALERWQQADETFSEAASQGASSFDLFFNRALCRLKLGLFEPAMEDLRGALEIAPAHPRAAEARELLQTGRSAGVASDSRFRFGKL